MPRITDYNDKFLYTKTDPTNIISAKKNAIFFRRYNKFYLNVDGNVDSDWIELPYRTVIIPVPDDDKPIFYEHDFEIWIKNSHGHLDEYREVLPKTDWKFYSYEDIFISTKGKVLNWVFPPPTSTNDPIGVDNNRSFDENFFYVKIDGKWYRTPITVYVNPDVDDGEKAKWHNNLPFVDYPRRSPPPKRIDSGLNGDQSYDRDFFYIKPSLWKRTPLTYFDLSKMTVF